MFDTHNLQELEHFEFKVRLARAAREVWLEPNGLNYVCDCIGNASGQLGQQYFFQLKEDLPRAAEELCEVVHTKISHKYSVLEYLEVTSHQDPAVRVFRRALLDELVARSQREYLTAFEVTVLKAVKAEFSAWEGSPFLCIALKRGVGALAAQLPLSAGLPTSLYHVVQALQVEVMSSLGGYNTVVRYLTQNMEPNDHLNRQPAVREYRMHILNTMLARRGVK